MKLVLKIDNDTGEMTWVATTDSTLEAAEAIRNLELADEHVVVLECIDWQGEVS